MADDLQNPLVTFVLLAYNQEKYIGEALEAALAQDYPNLEIIVSDDASTDSTWDTICQVVANYSGGHQLRHRRNPRNLGIGGHVATVNSLANGRLVVAGAGDDISCPDRVSSIAKEWLADGASAGLYHSSCSLIDAAGNEKGDFWFKDNPSGMDVMAIIRNNASVIGATEAWDKSLFDEFGPIRLDVSHEDHVLTLRAALLKKRITFISRPLVKYRQGSGVSAGYGSAYINPSARVRMLAHYILETQQKIEDAEWVGAHCAAGALRIVLDKYKIALDFESGFPRFRTIREMVARVGLLYVLRMALKIIRDRLVGCGITVINRVRPHGAGRDR